MTEAVAIAPWLYNLRRDCPSDPGVDRVADEPDAVSEWPSEPRGRNPGWKYGETAGTCISQANRHPSAVRIRVGVGQQAVMGSGRAYAGVA